MTRDIDIEDTRMPPDELVDCWSCGITIDVGDSEEHDTKYYCRYCINYAKDESIPKGEHCETQDGYACPYLFAEAQTCLKYDGTVKFDLYAYAPEKCGKCKERV